MFCYLRNCHTYLHSGYTGLQSHQQWRRAPVSPSIKASIKIRINNNQGNFFFQIGSGIRNEGEEKRKGKGFKKQWKEKMETAFLHGKGMKSWSERGSTVGKWDKIH